MSVAARVLIGDCRDVLATLPDASVQCCVTSPPYWGLRDYGVSGQIGLEKTPAEYVAEIVGVFREVRRVLRDDGVAWLNLGDSYNSNSDMTRNDEKAAKGLREQPRKQRATISELKPKDLVGVPWSVAFALRDDGWYLRSDIIWAKPNPMPESVTDRPTKAHEYVFLLSKSPTYFYDAGAIREGFSEETARRFGTATPARKTSASETLSKSAQSTTGTCTLGIHRDGRNSRSVWTIASEPCADAHFAVFPSALPRRCILASSKPGDTVLDPFGGSGTTGRVAVALGRNAILIELNPAYVDLAEQRTAQTGLGL